ncbi:lysophospholipid acyltransferase family protein [uncultured Roseibium sp.]|uniref:lysophospholipid acyltransferase family protein n=1 Tax=uncultured Roseibium sp. TaxID=1936171 RepID=UPI002598FD92|nr:lysophospholipid acyltransferase family protein [uncultured Roseibium sp.]
MSFAKSLKNLWYRLETAALRVAIILFRLIPVDIASAVMGRLWRFFAPLNSRHQRALQHLEAALPQTTAEERERIVRGMWENLGRVAAETFHIAELLPQDDRFVAIADETTKRVLAGEQQAVFVSFHSGNWEMCVQPAVRAGLDLAGVYQALKNPFADAALRDMRKGLYRLGLFSKSHQTARKLVRIVREGGVLAIMGDLRETRGIKVPFFGRPAYANPVPATLARSGGVPIILGRVVRTKGVHFTIEGRAIEVPVTDDRKADIQAVTEEIHRVFEEWIREHPEQWMWIHRKWAKA